jgi:hypothetical protein
VQPFGTLSPSGSFRPGRGGRPGRPTLPGTLLLFVVALSIAAVLYSAQFSGSVRWAVGVAVLTLLSACAWRFVVHRTSIVTPAPPTVQGGPHAAEFDRLSRAVQRASRGLPYSQVVVTSRARAAFLEHAGLTLGIDPPRMRELQKDPARLRSLVGDDRLAEFLFLATDDFDAAYLWVHRARARGGFDREFRSVLDRMEAWR